MYIEHLEALHFRNLQRLGLDLGPRPVVLRGPNAQGKTNTLEALYVCATGKSFRRARPRELLRHGAAEGWVRARLVRQGVRHDVEVSLQPAHRSVRVDGRGLRLASRLLELVNVVAFFPDDLRIVKGSPEERRRFLDRAVANHRPEFVDATLRYLGALRDRNALLRSERVDRALLSVYDEQLVRHGEVLHRCRLDTLAALAPAAAGELCEILGRGATLDLSLSPGLAPTRGGDDEGAGPDGTEPVSAADFPGRLAAALERSYPRDRARRMTLVGPHRADLLLSLDGQPARQFASQGQQRAIVLALKLAEVQVLRAQLGMPPILLLDDVSSELDAERNRHLFARVSGLDSQVWISTTGTAPLPLPEGADILEVEAGQVRRVGNKFPS